MRIDSLSASGFRGFEEHASIRFGTAFTIISGRNGTGKSSVCDAVEFALSGGLAKFSEDELGDRRSKEAQTYLWNNAQSDHSASHVTLTVSLSDGSTLDITRDFRGRLKNLSEIDLQNILFSEGSAAGSIDDLIRSSFIRDESISRLSLDLSDRERFKFVSSLLGCYDISPQVKTINRAFRRAGRELKEMQESYDKVKDQLFEKRAELSQQAAAQENNSYKDALRSLAAICSAPSNQNPLEYSHVYLRRISTFENQVRGVIRSLVSLDEKKDEQANTSTELKSIDSQLEQANDQLKMVEAELAKFASPESQLRQIQELRQLGAELGLTEYGECPLCGSEISRGEYESHLSTLENNAQQLAQQIASREPIIQQQEALSQRRRLLERTIADHKSLVNEVLSEFVALQSDDLFGPQIRHSDDLAEMQAISRLCMDNLATTKKRISSLQEDLADYAPPSVVSNLQGQVGTLQDSLDQLDKKIRQITKTRDALQESAHSSQRLADRFLDERLADLDPLLRELYSRLRPHYSWSDIRYQMKGDVQRTLSLMAESASQSDVNPSFVFSSGQRRAAGLAFLIALALSNQWSRFEPVIFDDPVQHVDDYRALHLVETLAAITSTGRQILCTVEDAALADLMCRRIPFTDHGEATRVNMVYSVDTGSVIQSTEVLVKPVRRIIAVG